MAVSKARNIIYSIYNEYSEKFELVFIGIQAMGCCVRKRRSILCFRNARKYFGLFIATVKYLILTRDNVPCYDSAHPVTCGVVPVTHTAPVMRRIGVQLLVTPYWLGRKTNWCHFR